MIDPDEPDDLDELLEQMVPGSGHRATAADSPPFPTGLDLEPRGVIARGSVGWVYEAWDPFLERAVAVKVSRPDGGANARRALHDEARTTSRLAHPAVLPVHRLLVADGLLCVVFALGPRRTLEHVIRSWRRDRELTWPSERSLGILMRVAEVVAHAHELGIVHGDLSPSNVAVDDAFHPYVLDWAGLVAHEGSFSGTPEFAAPECLAGRGPSAPSDVFALTAIAWELLAGRPLRPFPEGLSAGETVARLREAILPERPPSGVDPEIGELLVRGASPEPDLRPSARELADAFEAVLTGRVSRARRHAEAAESLNQARREWLAFGERERRLEEERRVAAVQRARIPPHAPPEAKVGLWASEARAQRLLEEQSHAWTRATELAMAAVLLEPRLEDAHALLAELWYERLRLSEAHDTPGERTLILERIRAHDRGRFGELFEGRAELTVEGTGSARIYEVVSDGRHRTEMLRHEVELPVERLELSAGSWVVEVPRRLRPLRLPVALRRVQHAEIVATGPEDDPDGFVFVPAGQFRMGGDRHARGPVDPCAPWLPAFWVARTCVTSAAYLDFLGALDPEEATRRVPGQRLVTGVSIPLWERAEHGWRLPHGWTPDWPVVGISLDDALAYASWYGEQRGLPLRLPTEDEWEKFARGADGRAYPWGEAFDACFCHMRDSLPAGPRLGPVEQFAEDRSPYGVADVAGGVHEWTTSVLTENRHVIRGGSWESDAQACRLASRAGVPPESRLPTIGFRLVAEAPSGSGSPQWQPGERGGVAPSDQKSAIDREGKHFGRTARPIDGATHPTHDRR